MYRVISKNRKTNKTEIVRSDRFGVPMTEDQAELAAVRFTMQETNSDVVYLVEQF